MQIIEFSMTPTSKLVYLWKFLLGLIWASVIVISSFKTINQDLNSISSISAAIAVIVVSNFIMLLVTIVTASLNNSIIAFIKNVMYVGFYSLMSLAVGGLSFVVISFFVPINTSLVVASMVTSIVFACVVIYIFTKLLNGNYMKIGAVNMRSIVVQAAIMYGAVLILVY